MNKTLFLKLKTILLLVCLLILCNSVKSDAETWQELKGKHFIVYFVGGSSFARKVLEKSETYYKKIADDLGYARYSNFWQWDNRVKIYIYPDREAYKAYVLANRYAIWSVGMANYKTKEIISYADNQEFVDSVLPHEITHLIFRDYVGEENIPIWIDEGIAQWEEKGKRELVKRKIRQLLRGHQPISMERMMVLNIGKINNEAIVELYYVQAVSLIDYLMKEYGAENFIFFCRQLRDGKNVDEALTFAYPTSIRSIEELEKQWLEYIK